MNITVIVSIFEFTRLIIDSFYTIQQEALMKVHYKI
jgi:hypothetical protein